MGDPVEEAFQRAVAKMHGIKTGPLPLGPTLTSEVGVDCSTTKALIDTGPPVSIISLDYFLKTVSAKRPPDQSPTGWVEEVRKRIKPSSMALHSYGGVTHGWAGLLQTLKGGFSIESVLQVQPRAPVDLILGTDTLPHLGFSGEVETRFAARQY